MLYHLLNFEFGMMQDDIVMMCCVVLLLQEFLVMGSWPVVSQFRTRQVLMPTKQWPLDQTVISPLLRTVNSWAIKTLYMLIPFGNSTKSAAFRAMWTSFSETHRQSSRIARSWLLRGN